MGYALSSGVDRLVLAVDFNWKDRMFFQLLEELRDQAAANECSMAGAIDATDGQSPWAFQVQAFGSKGYQWLLNSPEYDLKVGNWLTPRSRPSVMIDIHSETLWIQGAVEAIDRILALLKSVGAQPSSIKLSRVDLCLDLLVQAPLWSVALREHIVSRARKISTNEDRRQFTGFAIGRAGPLIARMYDKDLEIRTVSKKTWLYDIWNLEEVPENFRVMRIEFQLRREAGKELGLDSVWDFTNHPRNLWAYCTQCWLKFTDNPFTDWRARAFFDCALGREFSNNFAIRFSEDVFNATPFCCHSATARRRECRRDLWARQSATSLALAMLSERLSIRLDLARQTSPAGADWRRADA
jgi:hypothetical protein